MNLLHEIIESKNIIEQSIHGRHEEYLRGNTYVFKIKEKFNHKIRNNILDTIREKNYFEVIKNQDLLLNSECCPIIANRKFLLYADTRCNNYIHDRVNEWKAVGHKLSDNVIEANDNDFFIYGCNNFGHFIHEDLSRALLIGKLLGQSSRLFVLNNLNYSKLALLRGVGIDINKIICLDPKRSWHIKNINCIKTLMGRDDQSNLFHTSGILKEIRNRLVQQSQELTTKYYSKKIYLNRGNATNKRMVNEEILMEALQQHGFEIIDGLKIPIWDQIYAVNSAQQIIGALGASTALSIFASDKTPFIEIHPSEGIGAQYNCLHAVFAHQLDYKRFYGERVRLKDNRLEGKIYWDYKIQAEKLMTSLINGVNSH